MSKLVEILRDTTKLSDSSLRFAIGEKLWLDDYTAYNLVLIGIAKYAKTPEQVSRETERLV